METKNNTYRPETALLVEALRSLLQAEEGIFSGLTATYGEKPGEELWYKSPVHTLLESAKKEVKLLIGDSLELEFSGLLPTDNTITKEGDVC